MFERFTERARHAIVLAQDEARLLGHGYIGTEHLLLGLLREEEGIAARVLESLGVTLDDVRADVLDVVGHGDAAARGQIPFTPRAKKTLELSLREALALRHNYIGTEHLLLGMARENDGVAARVLLDRGVDAETIRNQVIGMLSGQAPRGALVVPPHLAEIELTTPPIASEVLAELEQLAAEKQGLMDEQRFDDAARVAERERRLRAAAAALVRAWQRQMPD